MTYIRRLSIKGFKSFARETNIQLSQHINVIVGPNGSGKSNLTDALCFVLGRLSIKSMRATKASHLIFAGNKQYKGANEAYVEISLDNSQKEFAFDSEEIIIRRIVRRNGQSIYKINKETKTRNEVLELLAQAGIDPHGFNIVLQGEIERFVKMPGEERRKVIEEVAGISVYEMRKEKSLKELEKTEEKLKQINAVLRERTNYLKNLEEEREQALKFKKLEETVVKCKASILSKKIQEREKQVKEIEDRIEDKNKEIVKKTEIIKKTETEIQILQEKIQEISQTIQKSSGFEQDTLLAEISTLKQEIAALSAKKENYESQSIELDRRKNSLVNAISIAEKEIEEMSKEKGKNKKKELEDKKAKLDELEELKREYFLLKSNVSSLNNQIEDKKRQIQRLTNESNFLMQQIEQTESQIRIKEPLEKHKSALIELKKELEIQKEKIIKLEQSKLEFEKLTAVRQREIEQSEKIKEQVSRIDICPLCKTKMTEEHLHEVIGNANKDISICNKNLEDYNKNISKFSEEMAMTKSKIASISIEINTREIDIVKLQTITDKKEQLKRNSEQSKLIELELEATIKKFKINDDKLSKTKLSEESYENLKLEVNELQRFEERNLGIEITTKQRELERTKLAIKQSERDKQDIKDSLSEIETSLKTKLVLVKEKEKQAEIVKQKYQKMFDEKNALQDKSRLFETSVMHQQNEKRLLENDINNFAIEKAQSLAKRDTLTEEFKQFENIELISMSLDKLEEKLKDTEVTLIKIGNVNLRALEVYEDIKKEYDGIKEKVDQLGKEKIEILSVIEEIDKKKKKVFVQTLTQVNELFSRNFSQLSVKGTVILEPQNKQDLFAAGLDIIVKVGGGKSFDITSLSGGEQTLVALSLIFAIQEFRPYCLYIFDEIDAALDRRNSEKLSFLLKKYMQEGQYLIITHNDSIISDASSILYGVSMQEGISKVLSLELNENN